MGGLFGKMIKMFKYLTREEREEDTGGRVIAVDLDGVLAQPYAGSEIGEPVPGAKEFLEELKRRGWTVVVFTGRSDKEAIEWLEKYGMTYDSVNANIDIVQWSNKVVADVYVDDRCVRFDGDFEKVLEEVERFRPWWQR